MFDESCLEKVVAEYKKDFVVWHWANENYKWKAVKCFKDNWDIDAKDFAEMLKRSLAKTKNLLQGPSNFARDVIINLAKASPEEVRAMYRDLYDETKDVIERISTFKKNADVLYKKYGDGKGKHCQTENAITTYLWLQYPDKYYIYKYTVVKATSDVLKSSYQFKKGAYPEDLRNFYQFYNEICARLKEDKDLVALLQRYLREDCWPDPELKTLTSDLGYYIVHGYLENGWWPSSKEYDPGITTGKWVELLNDSSVFDRNSLEVMKRFKDYGGRASCTQLAKKYGEHENFYNNVSTALADRVIKKTGCQRMNRDTGEPVSWSVLYIERQTEIGYVWKLRKELSGALDQVDLSGVKLYSDQASEPVPAPAPNPAPEKEPGFWWLNANPGIFSFSDMQVGGIQDYSLYSERGNKRSVFQNFLDAREDDLVIGYESTPVKQVVALLRVSKANDGQKIWFEKTEGLVAPIDYQQLKESPELENMEFFQKPHGTLFKLTKDEYDFIMDMIREKNPKPGPDDPVPVRGFSKEDFLSKVYLSEEKYDRLVGLLENKKNIILYGAPGVGKTFAAKKLAYAMMGDEDDSRIAFVQFHQNYSYEDFVMGYKPSGTGFELRYGVFYQFCQKAANDPERKYFFIIDEINRGNLSKIFGELLMLIEKDYRGERITLPYNGKSFAVPENLYIIGMMNTADRSLAMIDYALRRRFGFFPMEPAFKSEGFAKYQKSLNNEIFDDLIAKITELNEEITRDRSLGKGFCIGHSYFCNKQADTCTDIWMQSVVDYDILPMLSEYWFDDESRVQRWENILHGVFNDKG